MDIPHFVYPFSSDGHLGCFHFGAIKHAIMNIAVQVFVWTYIFIFSWVPQGGIGNSMFNLLKRCQNVSLSRKTFPITFQPPAYERPISLCPCQHLLLPVLL